MKNGNSVLIPQNTTYKEWYNDYMPKMTFNQTKDKNKGHKVKDKLNFQENINDFGITKIKNILYNNANKKQKIIKYENAIVTKFKNNKKENLAILDSNSGNLIGKITTGTRTTVSPSLVNMAKIITADKDSFILIHNHPENYSFSLTDIRSCVRFKSIDTMIIKTPDYTFYLKANNRNIKIKDLNQLYKKEEIDICKRYKSFNDVEKQDLIVSKISQKMGWIYEKEKNKP